MSGGAGVRGSKRQRKAKWPAELTAHCRQHLSDLTGLRVALLAVDFEESGGGDLGGGDSGGGETGLSMGSAAPA